MYGEHGFDTVDQWTPPIRVDPRHVPDLKRDRDRLKAHLAEPCAFQHAERCLAGIAALCIHQANLTNREAMLKLNAMASQLAKHPPDVVDKACRAYVETGRWFPAWADLVPLLDAARATLEASLSRLTEIIQIGERTQEANDAPRKGPLTPELQAKLAAIIGKAAKPMPGHTEPAGEPVRQPRYIKDGPAEWLQDRANQTRGAA